MSFTWSAQAVENVATHGGNFDTVNRRSRRKESCEFIWYERISAIGSANAPTNGR